jgi:hypothetical protein
LELFDDVEEQEEVNDLLVWWNRSPYFFKVFILADSFT